MCEGMANSQIFFWLQMYFGLMTKSTDFHKGTIDKFIGDAIFAFFAAPTDGLKCCIDWQTVACALNTQLSSNNMIQIGCGLHHGLVVFGVFGDDARRTCTLVSPEVNFTSRLEGLTKRYRVKILVSEAIIGLVDVERFVHATRDMEEVLKQSPDEHAATEGSQGLAYRFVGIVKVKGSQKTVKVYEVFQADDILLKQYKHDSKELFEKAVALRHAGEALDSSLLLSPLHSPGSRKDRKLSQHKLTLDKTTADEKDLLPNSLSPLDCPTALTEAPTITGKGEGGHADSAAASLSSEGIDRSELPPHLREAFEIWDQCEAMAKERDVTDTVIAVKKRHALGGLVDRFDEK